MSEVQIAIIDQENTQIALAVPGVQGPAGAISSGGSANQVFYKVSGTNYDAGWTFIGNANVDAAAAIAGTKISPNFGSQTVATTGVFSHALGSQGAPTITFTGDTNTGIYSPGADQVAISTNGTARLFVDASGNVGVGASSPDGLLTLAGANSNTPRFRIQHPSSDKDAAISTYFDGSGAYLLTGSNHYLNSAGSNTKFDATSGSAAWYLDGSGIGIFYNSSGSGAISERLRITSTGTVNIVGAGTAGSTQAVSFNGSAPVNSMVLTSGGLLGIGTSSPVLPLHVEATTDGPQTLAYLVNASTGGTNETAALAFALKGTAGTGVCRINAGKDSDFSTNPNIDSYLAFTTTLNDTESERLRITSAGNVGIGTTSPVALLQPNGTVSVTGGSGASSANGLHLYFDTATNSGTITAFHSGVDNRNLTLDGKTLSFTIAGTERARIDSSGRLLVGTSTTGSGLPGQADQKFQVAGGTDGGITMSTFSADPYACNLEFRKSRSGSVGTKTIVQNGDTLGKFYYCGTDGANFIPAAGIEAFVDGTPGSNDMPGRLVFSTTADGASSPTERMRIDNVGAVSTYTTGAFAFVPGTSSSAGTTNALLVGVYGRTGTTTGGSESIKIFSNGNIQNVNNSYGTLSDLKLKENIVDAGSQWADLKAIQVRNFNFKEGQTHRQIGVIAQEIEQVSPGLVYETPDRDKDGNETGEVTKGVNYSVLYMKAVKALQEAMERIEVLEQRLTDAGIA